MIKDVEKKYFKIGEIAAMNGVAASMIRFYESNPAVIELLGYVRRTQKGTRLFNRQQSRILSRIVNYRQSGKYTVEGAVIMTKKDFEIN